jgi:hypothetical protein
MDRQAQGTPNIDGLKDLQQVWAGLLSIYASKGIDLLQLVRDLVKAKEEMLDRWASRDSLNALREDGCNEYSLVLSLQVMEAARSHENKFHRALGSARDRDQVARLLDKAAAALEEFGSALDSAVRDDFASIPPPVLKTAQSLAKQIDPREDEAKWPDNLPAPHPNTIIRGLRFYSRMFRGLPQLWEVGMPYSESLGKYLLSAYVSRVTGKFHDAEVSALINSTLSMGGYEETAHRMWRSRNYNRIHKQCSSLVDFMVDVGVVIGAQA